MSSLLLVLLVLTLGSLTLQGMRTQQESLLAQIAIEKAALQESASAESLLEWGRSFSWPLGPLVQCQQHASAEGQVCLRSFADGTVLLIANSGSQRRWQTGTLSEEGIQFDHNGWSDFCPRKESNQCQMP